MNRQRATHIPIAIEAQFAPIDDDSSRGLPVIAQVVDINDRGMFVRLPRLFQAGTRFRMSIPMPGGMAVAYAMVRTVRSKSRNEAFPYGHGLCLIGGSLPSPGFILNDAEIGTCDHYQVV